MLVRIVLHYVARQHSRWALAHLAARKRQASPQYFEAFWDEHHHNNRLTEACAQLRQLCSTVLRKEHNHGHQKTRE